MVAFSASILAGRINLPARRWTRMKPMPTTRNNSRYATSPVTSNAPSPQGSVFVGPTQQLLPAGEAGVHLVPVGHLRLAVAPAQVDLVAVHPAGEVQKAGEIILQLDAQLLQLRLVLVHPFLFALELRLHLLQLFLIGVAGRL